jgi:NAD(P)-dependent dehydrogenase (short-subunit alcohol dehydrogenase family)
MNTSINQVCPGYIATDLTAGLKADAGFDAVVQERNPLGRWGGVGEFRGKGK